MTNKRRGLTRQRLAELLQYDAATGLFRWRVAKGHRTKGWFAGSLHDSGYLTVSVDKINQFAHRLAWLYMTGGWPNGIVDHRNRDKKDNKWSNLRDVFYSGNAQNINGPHRDQQLGVLGVYQHGHRFRSKIAINGKQKHLGLFDTIEEAAMAYQKAKLLLHPCARM